MKRSYSQSIRSRMTILGLAVITLTAVTVVPPAFAAGIGTRPSLPVRVHPAYWWRFPSLSHTVNEELFKVWMRAQFGPDWLRRMTDQQILMYWHRFLMLRTLQMR